MTGLVLMVAIRPHRHSDATAGDAINSTVDVLER